ncbi:MAG: hypothetical protein AB2L14_04555 [Candidatus Xenobiia bacterium LiM19]
MNHLPAVKKDFAFTPIEYYRIMKRIVHLKFVWLLLIFTLITVTSAFAMDLDCMMHGCHHDEGSNLLCHRERYFCSQITQTYMYGCSTPCLSAYIVISSPDFSPFTCGKELNIPPDRDRDRVLSLRAPPERAL